MKKSVVALSAAMLLGASASVVANDGVPATPPVGESPAPNLVSPNSLNAIIMESREEKNREKELKRLEAERDMLKLQAEVIGAQRELDRMNGVSNDPSPKLDVQRLRQELLMELQAQMAMQQEHQKNQENGEILHKEDGIDGITTVKIEEIMQGRDGLEAEVTTVGQTVRLVNGQTIYGWKVKEIEFDSITFEKDGVSKKLYFQI
jgi:hypothetical protein